MVPRRVVYFAEGFFEGGAVCATESQSMFLVLDLAADKHDYLASVDPRPQCPGVLQCPSSHTVEEIGTYTRSQGLSPGSLTIAYTNHRLLHSQGGCLLSAATAHQAPRGREYSQLNWLHLCSFLKNEMCRDQECSTP